MPLTLTRRHARRIAVEAQLLAEPMPTDSMAVLEHLGAVQADLTAYVAPSADLVLHSRIADYRPEDLDRLIGNGSIVELSGMLRPAQDIALYLDEMRHWPGVGELSEGQVEMQLWVEANDACRREILTALRLDGPLPTAALPDVCDVPWRSSGWTNNKNVQRLVGFMVQRGEVALAGREGRIPLWDTASRIYPDVEAIPYDDAVRIRAERRLHSLGIVRAHTSTYLAETNAHGLGEEAVVEGTRGTWRVDPSYLESRAVGRTVLLSPLDRLIFDRKRMEELFEFDYQLEMYKPVAKRRWGYYALPILDGDRLVGKVDARAQPEQNCLQVNAIHQDFPFDDALLARVHNELKKLASMLGLSADVR